MRVGRDGSRGCAFLRKRTGDFLCGTYSTILVSAAPHRSMNPTRSQVFVVVLAAAAVPTAGGTNLKVNVRAEARR